MFFSSSLIGDSAFDAPPNAMTQTKTPLLICPAGLETCVWPHGFVLRSFGVLRLLKAVSNYSTVSPQPIPLFAPRHFSHWFWHSSSRNTELEYTAIPLYHRLVTVFDVRPLQGGKRETFSHVLLLRYISLFGTAWNTTVRCPINLVLICPGIGFGRAHPPSLPYYQTVYLREN